MNEVELWLESSIWTLIALSMEQALLEVTLSLKKDVDESDEECSVDVLCRLDY